MPFVKEETAAPADQVEEFNPHTLLDALMKELGLKNDAALSRALEVAPPVISKIRHGGLPVGATILISMHELTGKSIAELRGLMGDRRAKFRGDEPRGKKSAPAAA